jgi:hypothetical protein
MSTTPEQMPRIRRDMYKGLVTAHEVRDARMSILEKQAEWIGWQRPSVEVDRQPPTFPYIFAWSQEQRLEVRPCRWADGQRAVWAPHKPNVGRPQFVENFAERTSGLNSSAFHLVRQRRAVQEDLCTMCGEPVDTTAVLWLSIEYKVHTSKDGWSSLLFPLFHRECIRQALDGCPFLRAGFGGFAPYRGPLRKRLLGMNSTDLKAEFGLTVHPDAVTVTDVRYQIPADEMAKLQRLAAVGAPNGLHWIEGSPNDEAT